MKAVFMMGGPASGKSTIRKEMFGGMLAIDCDSIKEQHPDYDPKAPKKLHAYSSMEATKQAYAAIGAGVDFVFDGTGSTAEKYVKLINAAHDAGYETEAVYVPCDLAVAIRRNSCRVRTVPESVVREKYAMIGTSVDIVSRFVGKLTIAR